VATGDGWKTSTSIPRCCTSEASPAPKEEMKLLVAAYSTVNGDGMAAAADDVNTKQPRNFLAVYRDRQTTKVAAEYTLMYTRIAILSSSML
jgi:hypothetical protein